MAMGQDLAAERVTTEGDGSEARMAMGGGKMRMAMAAASSSITASAGEFEATGKTSAAFANMPQAVSYPSYVEIIPQSAFPPLPQLRR